MERLFYSLYMLLYFRVDELGFETTEARIDIFIRIVGLIFLSMGIAFAYLTATTPLVAQITSVYYLISALSIVSGIVTLISKID